MKFLFQLCSFCLFLLTSLAVQANADLIPDKLVLQSTEQFGIVYTHQLKENQTIYGLSKFFNTNMQLISSANPGVQLNKVQKMQTVNIPINTDMLISERKLSPTKHYIPVFYTVKAKDNLFRISKVYFNQKIENVMEINNLSNMELSVGQKLLVGWYEYDPIYKSKLAWTEKGIEVDFAGNVPVAQQESIPSYVPVEKKREIARKSQDNSTMKFEKVVSTREHFQDPEPAVEKPVSEIRTTKVETTIVNSDVEKSNEVNKPFVNNTTVTNNERVNTVEKPTITSVTTTTTQETEQMETEGIKNQNSEIAEIEEVRELSNDPFEARNKIYQGDYDAKPTVQSKKIRAQWNSKSKDKVNLFALHASAKKGSYIEIYNPMLDRMVIAKVVGNIPDRIYKNNVELIVSPKVAETLGVVDKKFFVKIRYIE